MLRDDISGRAGWAIAHQEFVVSVNPIPTRGADQTHHITFAPPPHPSKFWITTTFCIHELFCAKSILGLIYLEVMYGFIIEISLLPLSKMNEQMLKIICYIT